MKLKPQGNTTYTPIINSVASKKRQGVDVLPYYVELPLEFDEFAGGGRVGGLDADEIETWREGAGVDGDSGLSVMSGLGLRVLRALGLEDNRAVDVVNGD